MVESADLVDIESMNGAGAFSIECKIGNKRAFGDLIAAAG